MGPGGGYRAYTGEGGARGATRHAARSGCEQLIFPVGRVDAVRRARPNITRGQNRRNRGRRRGRGGDDNPAYRASTARNCPPFLLRVAQQGPGITCWSHARRAAHGVPCTVQPNWGESSGAGHLILEEWEGWGETGGARCGRGCRTPCILCGRCRAWCHAPRTGGAAHCARCTVHRAPRENFGPWARGAPCTA